MLKYLFYLTAFLLVGCASSTKNLTPNAFETSSKAKFEDKIDKEANSLSIDIIHIPNEIVRMDVSGLLGIKVATILMSPKWIKCAIHTQKTFLEAPFSAKAFKPIFGQEIDPKFLWNVVHGQIYKDGVYAGTDVKTELTSGKLGQFQPRRLTIENSKMKLLWLLKSQKGLVVNSQNETFVLNPPDNYKLVQLK